MTDLPGRMIAVGRAVGDGGRSGGALVAVMKPADLGDCDDTPGWDRMYLAPAWAVATETLVRPRNVVVAEVRAKQATRVAFVEHDDEIEAFAANRADDALGEGILPGSARCNDDLANAHALDPALEVGAIDGIAIGEQVSGASLVRERVDDLLGRPRGVGWSVTPMWRSSRRSWRRITKPKSRRNARGGTTKKSTAAISRR